MSQPMMCCHNVPLQNSLLPSVREASTNTFSMFMEVLPSTEAPLDNERKWQLVTGKAELHEMPHSGHLVSDVTPEVLKCADATSWKSMHHIPISEALSFNQQRWCQWFLWIWCQQKKQSTQMPTSGSWQNSKSVSNESDLTKIQHKSCFSMTMHGHTSLRTWKDIIKFGWTVLPHPPYSPNQAHSDFNLFGALKNAIHTKKFQTNDVYCTTRIWLHEHDKAHYQQNIHTLLPCWHDTVDVDGSSADRVESQTITLPIV